MSQLFVPASPIQRLSTQCAFFSPSTTRYFVGLWISSDLRAITLESVTRRSSALSRLLPGDVSSR